MLLYQSVSLHGRELGCPTQPTRSLSRLPDMDTTGLRHCSSNVRPGDCGTSSPSWVWLSEGRWEELVQFGTR